MGNTSQNTDNENRVLELEGKMVKCLFVSILLIVTST